MPLLLGLLAERNRQPLEFLWGEARAPTDGHDFQCGFPVAGESFLDPEVRSVYYL